MKKSNKDNIKDKKTNMVNFMVTYKEYLLIEEYLKKYKIDNRSRWIRITLINHILKNMDHDYPTLFVENEMRR